MPFEERYRNRSWWKQRTSMERYGIILLVIAVVIIIGLIIGIATKSKKIEKVEKPSEDPFKDGLNSVCLTEGCVQAAAEVLTNMDHSINPCDDFYQFACGGFLNETIIPADKAEVNSFSILRDLTKQHLKVVIEPIESNQPKPFVLAKKLYSTCMNTTAIERDNLTTVKDLFKELGGWPIVEGSNWKEDGFDWKKFTHKCRRLGLNMDAFINFGFQPDAKNSSKRIIVIDQAELATGYENLDGWVEQLVQAYMYYQYMIDLAVFFDANRTFAADEVTNMIHFQAKISKISLTGEQRRDVMALYNPITIADLQRKYPTIQWLDFINGIIARSDKNVSYVETVNIAVPKFIKGLEDLMQNSSKRLKLAVGALYVRNYFHQDAKQNALKMVEDVRTAFVEVIKKLDWMDETTRKTAIDKALSIAIHIGYPDEFLDDKKLEDYYFELDFKTDNYLKIMTQIEVFKRDKIVNEFRDLVNKSDWTTRMASYDVNAGYAPQENSIQLPAGILQGIYFNKNRPHYMNYGGIAHFIGHEITHGFDDQGKRFDKDGNMVNWWANQTDKAFKDKAKCIVDQYTRYTIPEIEINLNGANTEGENIADNGGIEEAYLAYSAWVERNGAEPTLPGLNFTAKQMFWISAANCWCSKERKEDLKNYIASNVHSPNRYRVLVPFSNTKYFAENFNCPVGSKMNPKQKCQVW